MIKEIHFRQSAIKKIKKQPEGRIAIILKKIEEIADNPYRYKRLKKPLAHLRRVHIDKSFVLIFSVFRDKLIIEDFDHHDKIYRIKN